MLFANYNAKQHAYIRLFAAFVLQQLNLKFDQILQKGCQHYRQNY